MVYPYRKYIKPPLGSRPYKGQDIYKGLVGRWVMNEGSGATAYDLSGTGAHGTLNSDASWVPGQFGPCLDFDGNDDHVEATLPASLGDSDSPVSVSFWAKHDVSALEGVINIQGAGGLGDQLLLIYYDSSNSRLQISHKQNSSYGKVTGSITPGNWNHFVVTNAGGNVRSNAYVNGVLDDADVSDFLSAFGASVIQFGKGFNASFDFNGQVDNVSIYNRVLTASQAWQLYSMPFGLFHDPNETAIFGAFAGAPAGNAPTGTIYGPFFGPLGGPV